MSDPAPLAVTSQPKAPPLREPSETYIPIAIGIYVSEGSLRGGALGWDVTANGAGSDNGAGGGFVNGTELSGWNNLQLHSAAGMLPFDTVVKVGRSFGDTGINSKNSTGGQASILTQTLQSVQQLQLLNRL